MSQLGCRCGERMYRSDCPSQYILYIYYNEEVECALRVSPNITLNDFLTGWDEHNSTKKEYQQRKEPVDYWFCPTCKRVYEVQNIPQGRWLRIYKPTHHINPINLDDWSKIYVMKDTETDAAMDADWGILLSKYIELHDTVICYLSKDESTIIAIDKNTGDIIYSYALEDAWSPSAEI